MSIDPCNHCNPALDVLRLRAESDVAEPLNRECAMILVNYLMSLADHKACRCLMKSHDGYMAMHNQILDLMELSASLITTLNDDLLCFTEMEGASLQSSGMKSSLGMEDYSLSCDGSESMDVDNSSILVVPPSTGEVNGFTIEDRKELFNLLPFLLMDSYNFYNLYHKYHCSVQFAQLTREKESYVESMFDVAGVKFKFSPPFILTLASVKEHKLLDKLRDCFNEAKPGLMPPIFASKLILCIVTLKRLATDQTLQNFVYPTREAAVKFISDMVDEQNEMLRDPSVKQCAEHLWQSGRDSLEETGSVDVSGLELIVKHLKSPYLAPRLTAIAQLNAYISSCTDLVNPHHSMAAEDAGIALADFLSDNKVLQLLFGPNSHAEVLKQCPNLLNFMAMYGKMSKEDLDCIWSAAQMKHCGRQVFELLSMIMKALDPQLFVHLYSLLKSVKPTEHSEMTLQLAAYVTKMIWSYAIFRQSYGSVPSQQPLLPRPTQNLDERLLESASLLLARPEYGLHPEKIRNAKLDDRLNISCGSTQASTTGEGGGGDSSLGEELLDVGSGGSNMDEDADGRNKNSPPPLIESAAANDGKSGKRVQMCDDDSSDDRPLICHGMEEPVQKRARVVVDMAQQNRGDNNKKSEKKLIQHGQKLVVQEIRCADDTPERSTSGSSDESVEEEEEDEEVDENNLTGQTDEQSSDGESSDEEQKENVQRLMQHTKYPQLVRIPMSQWNQDTSIMLENMVKQKDVSNQRGYNDSDSDISSDVATSSDRLNDLEDDGLDLIAPGEMYVVDGDSVTRRQIRHSSPMGLEEELEEEDNGSSIDPQLIIDTTVHSSPLRVSTASEAKIRRNVNREAQVAAFLRHQQQVAQQHMAATAAALQMQQHNRHMLTNLAPHGKPFWQGRYLQLSESDVALFELSSVCEPGHTLLWDLVVDDGNQNLPTVAASADNDQQHGSHANEHLSPELHAFAMQMLEEVLSWAPSIFVKKFFLRGCVERLRNHKSVPTVLHLIRKIMASFRQSWRSAAAAVTAAQQYRNSGEEINPVMWADKELNLLEAFFDDLKHFRENQSNEDAKLVEQQLKGRMEFLEYVFSQHGTPQGYQINPDQLNVLWDLLSIDACGQELLHKWLLDQLKSPSQHALNVELLNHLLVNKVISFKGETLSSAGLAFLQAVLQDHNGQSPGSGCESGVDVCLPLIWSAALRNPDTSVAMTAMTFISNYYVHTGGCAQKEIQFIDSCMSHLRLALEATADDQLQASFTCIQRAILILRSHIDAFRKRHAFHLRMWELEGHGVKSHAQCVPHATLVDLSQIIRLNLQAPGVEKKAILEVLATDLLGQLRAEVTYWWKNVKKVPIIRTGSSRKSASTQLSDHDSSGAVGSMTIPMLFFDGLREAPTTVGMVPTIGESSGGAFVPFGPEMLRPIQQTTDELMPVETTQAAATIQNGTLNPILGALLSNNCNQKSSNLDGPLRLLCQGRELTADLDEKTLAEIALRDGCIIHVQSGGFLQQGHLRLSHHGTLSQGIISPGQIENGREKNVAPPDLDSMPMALLSTDANWRLLMDVIRLLNEKALTAPPDLAVKCRTWSSHVWDVIQLLPTYMPFIEDFQRVTDTNGQERSADQDQELDAHWKRLFDSNNLHYFQYSLQCLEMLASKRDKFMASGGIKHLINVLMDRSLFPKESGDWSSWEVDCLTSILRVVYNFSIDVDSVQMAELAGLPNSAGLRVGHQRMAKVTNLEMTVPSLDTAQWSGVDTTGLLATIMDLIDEFCIERPASQVCGSVTRLHGLQYAFQLLIAILLNDDKLRKAFKFEDGRGNTWLKRVLLDCQDPILRREVSMSLYRLCRGRTKSGGSTGRCLTPRLTVKLLELLKDAKDLIPSEDETSAESDQKSQRAASSSGSDTVATNVSDSKEPRGPSPSHYFWLLNSLLEALLLNNDADSSRESIEAEKQMADCEFNVDFGGVAAEVAKYILERPFYESKYGLKAKQELGDTKRRSDREQNQQTDAGLVGLLHTAIAILKFNPAWKFSADGQAFVDEVFDLIFALPTPTNGRHHPKCQSAPSRLAAYDLLVEMAKGSDNNFTLIYSKLVQQNSKVSHDCYGWEYWPQDERRAPCGYVGLMNLGATCYMASAMQQLFMIPRFRAALLNSRVVESTKHEAAFKEMQRMFAFLLESERKAYNPRGFCKVYQMNHQPLNITEQKDMAEFFTDLITKLEEMNPDLKRVVKNLFCGVMSNNVISLDCPHVSKTVEDFYTVRCQVSDMKDLHESLSEITVGDMLEGDNMYTCSQCNKKVRAEKRACFQKLPRILCFNTMRYTFNMVTMMKEKVNTHFSFPFRLNMSAFMEENLLPSHASGDETNDSTLWTSKMQSRANEYELIGVTVHTGTADGGHYYSFIRERDPNQASDPETDRWYSFNDADVRPWDPAQLAAECFGGEMTRHSYDTVTDKYMDLSFEKTNSAYMLFYERVPAPSKQSRSPDTKPVAETSSPIRGVRQASNQNKAYQINLPEDVERWISDDNVRFIQDLTFFDHAYFNFVWQICAQVPSTNLDHDAADLTFLSSRLSLSFFLETYLHSKEKATISQWMELLVKDLSASQRACEWFLTKMADKGEWPAEILLGCPSKSCREVFQKLCLHAILELHSKHEQLYLLPWTPEHTYDEFEPDDIGKKSSIGIFIKRLLSLLQSPQANVETRQFNEYFGLLLEFARNKHKAITLLQLLSAIQQLVNFYVKRTQQEVIEVESEEDLSDEELGSGLLSLVRTACGMRMPSTIWSTPVLERLLKLITLLLENGRHPGGDFKLRQRDVQAVIGGKGYPFLMQMIRDVNNPNVSGPLILSACRGNAIVGKRIIEQIIDCLKRTKEDPDSYLSLLSYFVDIAEKSITHEAVLGDVNVSRAQTVQFSANTAITYVTLILERMWELADIKAIWALKWLERNVNSHRSIVYEALIKTMRMWVEKFLLKTINYHVRASAGELLLSLIPSTGIRSNFAALAKGMSLSPRPAISAEAASVLHKVYEHLLHLLRNRAAEYAADPQSTHRLVTFFQALKACLVSKDEKLMVVQYVPDLWHLFHTFMMEKPVKINANKSALLTFWYMACVDCPEMIQASVKHPPVQQYFMYNFIHITDDDEDLTNSNKLMLHAFYGLMRLFCAHSPTFCDMLIRHENMMFACNSVATKECYSVAREEIFGAIEICCHTPGIEQYLLASFKEKVWATFLQAVAKSRANFPLLLKFMKIALDTPHDKMLLLRHHILPVCSEAFCTLQKMHHEASGCNVLADLSEMLKRFNEILKFASRYSPDAGASSQAILSKLGSPPAAQSQGASASSVGGGQAVDAKFEEEARKVVAHAVGEWVNMRVVLLRLMELLNSFIPPEIRKLSMDCIREIVALNALDSLKVVLSEIKEIHSMCRAATTISNSVGPYFPKRGQTTSSLAPFRRIHPPRPMFNMCLQSTQLEAAKGVDATYDQMLLDYFQPYHQMVDRLLRTAFNLGPERISPALLAEVSCLIGYECIPLHSALFPKLWLDLWNRLRDGKNVQKQIDSLFQCSLLREYIEAVLIHEQHSLINSQIFNFIQSFMDKCQQPITVDRLMIAIENALGLITDTTGTVGSILQAAGAATASPSAVNREVERLPIIFSRARGAFRALYLAYSPDRLPPEVFKGELNRRLIEMWTKFKSGCREKLANVETPPPRSPVEMDDQQDAPSTSGTPIDCRVNLEQKMRQYYSDNFVDSEEIIGALLNRLEIPEMPVEEEEKEGRAEKEEAKGDVEMKE